MSEVAAKGTEAAAAAAAAAAADAQPDAAGAPSSSDPTSAESAAAPAPAAATAAPKIETIRAELVRIDGRLHLELHVVDGSNSLTVVGLGTLPGGEPGAAARAGLRRGDRLVEVGGRDVRGLGEEGMPELGAIFAAQVASIAVTVERGHGALPPPLQQQQQPHQQQQQQQQQKEPMAPMAGARDGKGAPQAVQAADPPPPAAVPASKQKKSGVCAIQ